MQSVKGRGLLTCHEFFRLGDRYYITRLPDFFPGMHLRLEVMLIPLNNMASLWCYFILVVSSRSAHKFLGRPLSNFVIGPGYNAYLDSSSIFSR